VERRGVKVIYLNIGDPLRCGFKPFKTLKRALAEAAGGDKHHYSPSEGLAELGEAISKREFRVNGVRVDPEDVIVTQGVSEGINCVMATLVEPGDRVLLPSPTYPLYANFVRFYGGIPVFYRLRVSDSKWEVDVDDLRKRAQGCKAVVVINPNTPTGGVCDKHDLEVIAEVAAEYNMVIISDEIYDSEMGFRAWHC